MAEGEEDLPRDAKIVKSLLKSTGVEEYEPRVIHQFLELWYRYVVDVLTDAQVLLELARNRNKILLPKAIPGPGIPLPPEQDTLISTNYQFAIPKKQPTQAMEETEDDEESVEPNLSQEQKTDVPHPTTRRVSFPLTKRPK